MKRKRRNKIKQISKEEAYSLLKTGRPKGYFICHDIEKNQFIALDNTKGYLWAEAFKTLEECFEWIAER